MKEGIPFLKVNLNQDDHHLKNKILLELHDRYAPFALELRFCPELLRELEGPAAEIVSAW